MDLTYGAIEDRLVCVLNANQKIGLGILGRFSSVPVVSIADVSDRLVEVEKIFIA